MSEHGIRDFLISDTAERDEFRDGIDRLYHADETEAVERLLSQAHMGPAAEERVNRFRAQVEQINRRQRPGRLLDVGCGLGGASRFAAQQYDCRVTGIDLTHEYIHINADYTT